MIRFSLFLLTLLVPSLSFSLGAKQIQYKGVKYDVYVVSPNHPGLRFYWKNASGQRIRTVRRLRSHLKKRKRKVVFAMNGGIFEYGQTPLGLYIENYKTLVPVNRRRGRGNFFVQPNGIFYLTRRKAYVRTTRHFRRRRSIKYAVQSGPMLVINNRINPVFRSRSNSTYIRNGVGVDRRGNIVFAISNSAVNFYRFSAFLKYRMKCTQALYLDGNISQMYLPALGRYEQDGQFASILAIITRTRK
jgi:uncharacterized protein YigE (DUF2233 family)